MDFGPEAAKFSEEEVTLDWYNFLFKGVQNRFTGKPVKIFVMGSNRWRDEDAWPLTRARATRYYLHAAKGANSVRGDGSLSAAMPTSERADQFAYDPANPVPTIGGPLCCDSLHLPAGPRDQRTVEDRPDVLVYSTPPLSTDVEVTGPVSLDVYVKSSAVDSDITAKLVDVWPNGFAQNLTEGILRLRYRDSQEQPQMMKPGKIYRVAVDLWSTSNVFKHGHSIRLEVGSSNFPRFNRNLNTGSTASIETGSVQATNTVLHDPEHPSALILPLVQ